MEITKKQITSTYIHQVAPYALKGTFVVTEGADKLDDFKAEIFSDQGAYKGNAFLKDGVIKYNFNDVAADEMTAICAACEECVAEATKNINA